MSNVTLLYFSFLCCCFCCLFFLVPAALNTINTMHIEHGMDYSSSFFRNPFGLQFPWFTLKLSFVNWGLPKMFPILATIVLLVTTRGLNSWERGSLAQMAYCLINTWMEQARFQAVHLIIQEMFQLVIFSKF